MSTFDPDALECLAAIIEEGGFERAAQRLSITQSAVSQRLRALESSVGRLLVVRSRPLRLPEPGKVLLRHARQMQALRADIARELGTVLGADERLPIAVNADSLATWLAGFEGATVQGATLINNAGVVGLPAALDQVPAATLALAMRAGLEAPLLLTAAFLAATRGWAAPRRVLNISSGLGRRAMAGSAVYCAAKAGLQMLTMSLARELQLEVIGTMTSNTAGGVVQGEVVRGDLALDGGLRVERLRMAALPGLAGNPLLGMDVLSRLTWQQGDGVLRIELRPPR